jgi:hypothetical protein
MALERANDLRRAAAVAPVWRLAVTIEQARHAQRYRLPPPQTGSGEKRYFRRSGDKPIKRRSRKTGTTRRSFPCSSSNL